jgi:hypothetical protein
LHLSGKVADDAIGFLLVSRGQTAEWIAGQLMGLFATTEDTQTGVATDG